MLDENESLRREIDILKGVKRMEENTGRQKSRRPAAKPEDKKGKQGEVTPKKEDRKGKEKEKKKNGGKMTFGWELTPNVHYELTSEKQETPETNRQETIEKFRELTKSRKKEPSSVDLCSGKEAARCWLVGKQALRKKSPVTKSPDKRNSPV